MTQLTSAENARLYIEYSFDKSLEVQELNQTTFKVILEDGYLMVKGIMNDEVIVYNYDIDFMEKYKLIDPVHFIKYERVG